VIDYLLAETMYVKDLFGGPNAGKPYSQTQQLLLELELDRMHPSHKAFMLALIRSGKVNIENLTKVVAEVKLSANAIDTECIYCKYS